MAVFAKGGALHGEGLGGVCARLDVLVSEMISINGEKRNIRSRWPDYAAHRQTFLQI